MRNRLYGTAVCLLICGVTFGEERLKIENVTPENLMEADAQSIYYTLAQAFHFADFDKIDALFDHARKNNLRDEDGGHVILDLYDHLTYLFDYAGQSDQEYFIGYIKRWREQNPDSPTALTYLLYATIDSAWDARGSKYAHETSKEQFDAFHELMVEMLGWVEDNYDLVKDEAFFHDQHLTLLMASNGSYEEIVAAADRYWDLAPGNFYAYRSATYAFTPRWSGSYTYAIDLAMHVYERTKEEFGFAGYFVVAEHIIGYEDLDTVINRMGFRLDDIVRGAVDYDKHFHYNNWGQHHAARWLCLSNERNKARIVFEAIGDTRRNDIWVPALFDAWRAWAMGKGNKPRTKRIHEEAIDGNIDFFTTEIDRGTNINDSDENGGTPIYHAAYNDHWDLVELLAKAGANPFSTYTEESPLHFAIIANEEDTAITLVKNGIDATGADVICSREIEHAVKERMGRLVQELLKVEGINLDWRRQRARHTAFSRAVYHEDFDTAKALLDAGANIDVRFAVGSPLLHSIAYSGTAAACQFLLDQGADPTLLSGITMGTALHEAASGKNPDTVKVLLAHEKVDVNQRGLYDRTALHAAAAHGQVGALRLLLDDPGIEVDVQDTDRGWTPLHQSVDYGNMGCVRALTKAGARTDLKDLQGRTAADLAREKGQDRLLRYLE